MKNIFTPALFLLMSAGCLTLLSCQKDETLKNPAPGSAVDAAKNSSGGGGGNSGGGHNGGGGGILVPPTPTDTVPSLLPIGDIITVGNWKVSSFIQGNDNNTAQFAAYVFTFKTDGTLIADNNGSQTFGTWHYQEAVFYYGISTLR